ncbi:MAG: hypothetical protein J6B49_01015 [Phascolarctobacterium sp.]|nr:hypothetical protein [Phascolarctobacterium sp.]
MMKELDKRQKRTCNNCKALVADRCWLTHQIKKGDVGYIPLEPCEKPTSLRMLARLLHYKLEGLI